MIERRFFYDMLKVQEARKILGKTGEKMADDEIEKLRNSLYSLASQLLDNNISSFVPTCKKQ